MSEPLECELCDANFEPGGLSPICNRCWNRMAVERNRYRAALEKIKKGIGPYSQDRLQHASDTIEAMRALAVEALRETED